MASDIPDQINPVPSKIAPEYTLSFPVDGVTFEHLKIQNMSHSSDHKIHHQVVKFMYEILKLFDRVYKHK